MNHAKKGLLSFDNSPFLYSNTTQNGVIVFWRRCHRFL